VALALSGFSPQRAASPVRDSIFGLFGSQATSASIAELVTNLAPCWTVRLPVSQYERDAPSNWVRRYFFLLLLTDLRCSGQIVRGRMPTDISIWASPPGNKTARLLIPLWPAPLAPHGIIGVVESSDQLLAGQAIRAALVEDAADVLQQQELCGRSVHHRNRKVRQPLYRSRAFLLCGAPRITRRPARNAPETRHYRPVLCADAVAVRLREKT